MIDYEAINIKSPITFTPNRDYKWSIAHFNNNSLLVRMSSTADELLINTLNLDSLSVHPTIKIPAQGPNGYRSSSPIVHYHSPDSIYVLTTSINEIIRYDRKGDKKELTKIQYDFPLSLDSNEDQQSFFIADNSIYGYAVPYLNPNNKNFFDKAFRYIQVDLSNGNVIGNPYPADLSGKILPTDFLGGHTIQINDSIYLYNDYRSHKVKVINRKTSIEKDVIMGFEELEEFKPGTKPINNADLEKVLMVIRHPKYYSILYDRRNNLIYRFTQFLNPKYNNLSDKALLEELSKNNMDLIKNAVIVSDIGFTKTVRFEIDRHDFYAPFKDGLLTPSYSESDLSSEEFYFYDLAEIIAELKTP